MWNLLVTRWVVSFKNFFEFLGVIVRYYPNFSFCKQDLTLLSLYFWESPYSISKEHLQKLGELDLYTYGETPLKTLEMIAKRCSLTQNDYVVELGCGRGRSCFWLHSFIGCRVLGVDYIPAFIEKAKSVKSRYRLKQLEFQKADFFEVELKEASVIYLYGTCLEENVIKRLVQKIAKLQPGTKIITVSFPLLDYTDEPLFNMIDCFTAPFTWGRADVYLQELKIS